MSLLLLGSLIQSKPNLLRTLPGTCPLSSDGAFGLIHHYHRTYLCATNIRYRSIFEHLLKSHKLTMLSASIVCRAIYNRFNPSTSVLFQLNDVVIDRTKHLSCPFSIHSPRSSIVDRSSQRECRWAKIQEVPIIRRHLMHYHQMTEIGANELLGKLKHHAKGGVH